MMFRLLACIAQYQANAYNFINYTCIHAGTLVNTSLYNRLASCIFMYLFLCYSCGW